MTRLGIVTAAAIAACGLADILNALAHAAHLPELWRWTVSRFLMRKAVTIARRVVVTSAFELPVSISGAHYRGVPSSSSLAYDNVLYHTQDLWYRRGPTPPTRRTDVATDDDERG